MKVLQVFAIAMSMFTHVSHVSYALYIPVPQPAHGKVHLCDTKHCLDAALRECKADNGLFITMVVSSFAHDPYVPLYLGWVQHVFSGSEIGDADGERELSVARVNVPLSESGPTLKPNKLPQMQHFVLIEPSALLSPERLHHIETVQGFELAAQQGIPVPTVIRALKVYESAVLLFCEPELQSTTLRWVFVALQHGDSACKIASIANMQVFNPHLPFALPRVLVHLNHEKPWEMKPEAPDFTFPTIEKLRNAYALFPLVIRNYYSRKLITVPPDVSPAADVPLARGPRRTEGRLKGELHPNTRTLFFPLGPSYYGYLVGNSSTSVHLPASQRTISCYFAGRKIKPDAAEPPSNAGDLKQDHVKAECSQTGTGFETSMCARSPNSALGADASRFQRRSYKFQRSDMFNILEQEQQQMVEEEDDKDRMKGNAGYQQLAGLASCEFTVNVSESETYISYLHTLSNVIFALCPAGNNPETFRIYEAMERGAIPILIRPAEIDIDFIRSEMWGGQAEEAEGDGTSGSEKAHQDGQGKEQINGAPDRNTVRKHSTHPKQRDNRCGAYPGPVFDTWDEADRYLTKWVMPIHGTEKALQFAIAGRAKQLNKIQSDVMKWYENMKRCTVHSVADALHEVFS